ncbi:hypothetical protein HZB00_03165 [Candidatus Woesearchaeota archaeon]|nr:hypothetical protein [Candidatus Woesearchaeota archaeon]
MPQPYDPQDGYRVEFSKLHSDEVGENARDIFRRELELRLQNAQYVDEARFVNGKEGRFPYRSFHHVESDPRAPLDSFQLIGIFSLDHLKPCLDQLVAESHPHEIRVIKECVDGNRKQGRYSIFVKK